MAIIPKYLTHYPNMDSAFPFHLRINRLEHGFESHRHDFLEFSYVIEGRGSEMINGVEHPMVPGAFTLVMPYQYHEIISEPGAPLRLYNCNFGIHLYAPGEELPGIDPYYTEELLPPFAQMDEREQGTIRSILEEMRSEYEGAGLWKNAIIKAKLTEVLVRFDRFRRREWGRSGQRAAACAKLQLQPRGSIWQVIRHIHDHYQDELTLSGMAERFGFSVPYLSELFKKTVGQNFLAFVHEVRIRQACGLLISTEMNVSDIAMETGYGSYNTFSRIFRETKGMTPAEYRKLRTPGTRSP
ncbi:AraC family transcriptional regulator [Paenibacillus doosanensis]|uniref:AraC family transcriptional regulator n=1 Tax=Paenibacillus doosanensis TaxID=1229154 RepID=UPI00217FB204|nr:AraC family transcriptional regulator [Paenibacillus doosanensis]MCS7458678.1 AraC family transcriptional regulator [Paenibacillus doosanensis]